MTDFIDVKECNNNYDETRCPLCKQQYDEDIRVPRILLNCGHTICSLCITSSINSSIELKCPEDNTEYKDISLSSFPINKALIRLLQKISESKNLNISKESSLTKILNIKTPKTSPKKELHTARESRINLENLKLASSKKCEKCADHPSRNLEIICLEDICKICTNCAIFGKHKNHHVINIDEFVKDVENKASKLIELFENIIDGEMKKELDMINDKNKNNLNSLLEVINNKFDFMTNIIKDFTKNLVEKVQKDEKLLIGEISAQFDKLKNRVNFYLELPEKININVLEWKNKVQDNMDLLNKVKDLSNECLKFVDCYGDNSYNKLIKSGNNIISDIQRIVSFPVDEIKEEIKNLNLSIENQILNQEFFHINKKLDFGDLCQKYEIPKITTNKKENSVNNVYQKITVFCEHDKNESIANINNNKKDRDKSNSLTDDSINGGGKSSNNLFSQKEMEIEDIEFGDDSFLFTDLDLIGLDFENKNENKLNGNKKKETTIRNINNLNLNNNIKANFKLGHVKNTKSTDLLSIRNNISYDRDSFNISIKKTPENKKKTIKKTKSHINFNKNSSVKSKSRNKLKKKLGSNKTSKEMNTNRSLSPLFSNQITSIKNIFKKNEVINLSRNKFSDEIILTIAQQITKYKEKIKEIKLMKCGLNNESAVSLLKSMENCVKLNFVNLANNSLNDAIVNNIANFLKKNNSILSCYFTNNNFSTSAKEIIKSYNRNGKIKIFV